MRALLMHPDRDFNLEAPLPAGSQALSQDLELDTLIAAMQRDDRLVGAVARAAILMAANNDLATALYRQEVVADCLEHSAVIRRLYDLAVEAIEAKRRNYFGYISHFPSSVLHGSVGVLELLLDALRKLKQIADEHIAGFRSRAFTVMFATIQRELAQDYLATVEHHLGQLKFKSGMLVSAQLGPGNEGIGYVLREPRSEQPGWFDRLLGKGPPAYTFRVHERDEAGARTLSDMRNRGLNSVANAVAQATDHIAGYFDTLRTELAFYVGCLNLREALASFGAPICLPQVSAAGSRVLHCRELYDPSLALRMGHPIVGNTVAADGMNLIIITGANQGGKSSFLRAAGLAQLMLQCGMFVAAESFAGEVVKGLFAHYKREEDPTMKQGKLDEELSRLSAIADSVRPNGMVLFNESFAATNEREGSEIARQVVSALLEAGVKVLFVTHLFDFAHSIFASACNDVLFLRAERLPDGTRTFRFVPGEPLETSYGADVYRAVFGGQQSRQVLEEPDRGGRASSNDK